MTALSDKDAVRLISNPLRATILTLLDAPGPTSPAELARALDVPVDLVAYHVGLLRDAGAAELVDERPGARGSTEHFYRAVVAIAAEPVGDQVFKRRNGHGFFSQDAKITVRALPKRGAA